MTIFSTQSTDGTLTLRVTGRFDYRVREAFTRAWEEREVLPECIRIDLRDAEYVDSSALGMLLVLRERAQERGASVALCGASTQVARTLQVARFGELFEVA